MAGLKTIIGLAFVLACGFLLVILSCGLFENWLPLLVAATYIMAPFPNWIFSRCAGNEDYMSMSDSPSGWKDFGQFLTGAVIVTGLCLPLIFAHADMITYTAMLKSTIGGVLIYGTIIAYSHFFASEGDDF